MRYGYARRATMLAVGLMVGLLFCASVRPVAAQIGADFTGGGVGEGGGGWPVSLGWRFMVSETVTVDSLGFWDERTADFDGSVHVSLWRLTDTSGVLLADAQVTSGSTRVDSTCDGGAWLFESIAGVDLSPGLLYAVTAYYPETSTAGVRNEAIATYAPYIAVDHDSGEPLASGIGSMYDSIEGWIATGGSGSYFGANIHVAETADVPEPGSLALLGGLCVSTLLCGRRLKRRTK